MGDCSRVRKTGVGAAQIFWHIGMLLAEAFYVHFIEH